jgi:hypothetical protein
MAIEISLTRGLIAIVDDEDAELAKFKWHIFGGHRTFYAMRNLRRLAGKRPRVSLHRAVWARAHPGEPMPPKLDHRDGNGLNCRRSNLRPATTRENGRNRRMTTNNKAGYIGVYLCRTESRSRPWRAELQADGQRAWCGYFETSQAAAIARDVVARDMFGDFATLNFPQPGERSAIQ